MGEYSNYSQRLLEQALKSKHVEEASDNTVNYNDTGNLQPCISSKPSYSKPDTSSGNHDAHIPKKEIKKASSLKMKKAPGAPRRFKSAYMFFSTAENKKIRSEFAARGEKCTTPQVAKLVSQTWKSMSETERAHWHALAAQDKARFSLEMATYKGPLKVDARMYRKKDPNAPKRPLSIFLAYSKDKRSEVKAKYPGYTTTELSTVLSRMWKEAPEEVKQPYQEREKILLAQYRRRLDAYKKSKAKDRKEREMKVIGEAVLIGLVPSVQAFCNFNTTTYEEGKNRQKEQVQRNKQPTDHKGQNVDDQIIDLSESDDDDLLPMPLFPFENNGLVPLRIPPCFHPVRK